MFSGIFIPTIVLAGVLSHQQPLCEIFCDIQIPQKSPFVGFWVEDRRAKILLTESMQHRWKILRVDIRNVPSKHVLFAIHTKNKTYLVHVTHTVFTASVPHSSEVTNLSHHIILSPTPKPFSNIIEGPSLEQNNEPSIIMPKTQETPTPIPIVQN